MKISRRLLLKLSPLLFWQGSATRLLAANGESPVPLGKDYPKLDSLATGEWWKKSAGGKGKKSAPPPMKVPRHEVVAFALYTADRGVLKMTAQLFPLMPDEAREARLEFERDGKWQEEAKAEIVLPGWSAHFRIENWDDTKDVKYRVRHGKEAMFEGTVRKDPKDKEEIVIANMSCNSSRTTGLRPEIVEHLLFMIPTCFILPVTRPTATPSTPPAGSSSACSSGMSSAIVRPFASLMITMSVTRISGERVVGNRNAGMGLTAVISTL